eukprot:7390914-Ditylum_brightwellii.AAC.1
MVLSSYMMSPSYCGYLERKGQHRVGFLGQVKKIVNNCMYLLLLINIIQGRNLTSKVDKAKCQGSRIYRSMRTPLQSLRVTLQDTPEEATNKCRDTSVEGVNEGSMMYHIYLLGEQLALANEGVAPGTEETEKMYFLEEDSIEEFGLDNCCTIHVCHRRELFKTLNAPPEGQYILGVGDIRKLKDVGTVVFFITDSERTERENILENVLNIPDVPKKLQGKYHLPNIYKNN